MKIQLHHHERKGWWKAVSPDRWAYRAKARAKINDRDAVVLFDTGAEVSLISSSCAHELELEVDPTQAEACEGVGGVEYRTEGSCVVKLTLANELVYEVTLLVGPMAGQDMILGLDFLSRAGARVDAADGSVHLPGDVHVPFEGRKQLFSAHARPIFPKSTEPIEVGGYLDVPVGKSNDQVLWICRHKSWVTSIQRSTRGVPQYVRVTNTSGCQVLLKGYDQVGVWMTKGLVPRKPGFVYDGSRRSKEWENIALSNTADGSEVGFGGSAAVCDGPMVERRSYPVPRSILRRGEPSVTAAEPPEASISTRSMHTGDSVLVGDIQREEVRPVKTVRFAHTPVVVEDGYCSGAYPRWRIQQVTSMAELELDQEGADDEVVIHEGEDPTFEEIEGSLAKIPDIRPDVDPSTTPQLGKEDLRVGDSLADPKDCERLRDLIWKRRGILMGKGDATPPAARGVICDIDVGSAKPVAQPVRKVRPEYLEKLFVLIKALLANGLIRPSKSRWASPIVIVRKKNGEIRLCIDYRMVNAVTLLMVYPMPLVSDLLEELHGMMWYCSLDMASGFWVVPMTDRARSISAFITPFGLFEWLRMPFGLKNAPQIYQRIVDNVVYNTFRLSERGGSEEYDVFEDGQTADPASGSLMQRRSYIDDFLIPAKSWDQLCERVERFLDACVYWNLSISVEKSVWGMSMVEYLGHKVDRRGIQANPKNLDTLEGLTFPTTLKAMQSFLGSVNYYSRFIDDYATIAAVLYEWRPGQSDCEKARYAFKLLKSKICTAPGLRHFDPAQDPVIVVYATQWSIAGALCQQGETGMDPVRFTSRVLKKHERNYSDAEKEILALLRVLDVCFNMVAGRRIRVWTTHSTVVWLWRTKGLQGRLAIWAAMLSGWTLEIERRAEEVHSFVGLVAVGSVPVGSMNEALELIAPLSSKSRIRIQAPIPTLPRSTTVVVASFDGSARSKRNGGSCSAILWKFPEWTVIRAASRYFDDITVNEAEYRGIQLALELAEEFQVTELVLCGDSKLVIQQLRREMECKAVGLQLLWADTLKTLGRLKWCELVHVKREWNASADLLATRALQAQAGSHVLDLATIGEMTALNRLHEVIRVAEDPEGSALQAAVLTRRQSRQDSRMTEDPEIAAGVRLERIRVAQDEEVWIQELKMFLNGRIETLSNRVVERCAKVADSFEVDDDGILYHVSHPNSARSGSEDDIVMQLVIPTSLVSDVLHHYHNSLEGGHQGISRTYAKVRRSCYWKSMYRDVQRYVASCIDCQTGKGLPWIRGRSPGNIQATYPFQVIAMDHIPSMPASYRGNTELLLWVDLFTGFVIAKANSARTAPVVAESYEECVFRRFGASECIRHDREPGFMANFFKEFNRLMGQRQRATMAYRPQANGSAERMVQTITRSIRMYVEDEGQRDWDDYAERLVFALNTSHDRVRDETPFYLVHGWDPKTTLESTMLCGSEQIRDRDPRRWRFQVQRQYMYARRQVEQRVGDAQANRAEHANSVASEHPVEIGSRVWLYIERVREGLTAKLAHKWHGPFRVIDSRDGFMYKLDVAGSGARIFPWVHVSRLKVFKESLRRPNTTLNVDPEDRLDFDEALLPEDSFEPDPEEGMFEVEALLDRRVVSPRTRNGRHYVEYQVKWKGYEDPSWIREQDLNCGGLIFDFNQKQRAQNRFQMMQSTEIQDEV